MTSRPSSPDSADLDLVHQRDQIDRASKSILDALARHGYTESSRFAVRLALEEALANAFTHGCKGHPPTTPIHLSWSVKPAEARITIEDCGRGFDPSVVPDPTLDANLEMPSGRGLMLMRAYMTSVSFNDKGNRVEMVYRKPQGKG